MNRPVLLVTMNGDGPATGFASRVWLMTDSLRKRDKCVHLLRFYPMFKSQGSWRQGAASQGVKLLEIPVLPISRFSLARWLTLWFANVFIHLYARFVNASLIQTEAHEAAGAVLLNKITDIPVVVDFHGACIEEARSRHALQNRQTSLQWLENAERRAVSMADACLIVSRPMLSYLLGKHGEACVAPMVEIPVCVEEEFFLPLARKAARKALGIAESTPLLVYCGGAQEYQCLADMRRLLEALSLRLPDVHLLIVSRDEKAFRDAFQGLSDRISLFSASKSDVPHLLVAADAALLLRRDHILNRVSCPTKFAEYLACGVPVITTPWAGHAGELVQKYNAGIVITDVDSDVDGVAQWLQHPADDTERKRLQDIAAKDLHWRAAEAMLHSCHQSLMIRNKQAITA